MFDDLIRTLKQFEAGQKIAVSVAAEADADGYIDRECPAEQCLFRFKIHQDVWREKVRDEEVFCPFCGHAAPARSWLTREQVDHAKQQAISEFKGIINDAMRRDAVCWNGRQSRNSFITITMNVNSKPRELILPTAATDPMRLKIDCTSCGCRYSVIGSAFFCPACGHSSVDRVFDQSLSTISGTLESIPIIRERIPDKDAAENTIRLVIENGMQQTVTAFQRLAESLYLRAKPLEKPRRNAFQNLEEGSALWHAAFGKSYSSYLSDDELNNLRCSFQQRHLLAHREGLVDDDYLARSGDKTYRIGQRIVIRDADVSRFVKLVKKLAEGLRSDVRES